jgi:hypothetical protein
VQVKYGRLVYQAALAKEAALTLPLPVPLPGRGITLQPASDPTGAGGGGDECEEGSAAPAPPAPPTAMVAGVAGVAAAPPAAVSHFAQPSKHRGSSVQEAATAAAESKEQQPAAASQPPKLVLDHMAPFLHADDVEKVSLIPCEPGASGRPPCWVDLPGVRRGSGKHKFRPHVTDKPLGSGMARPRLHSGCTPEWPCQVKAGCIVLW